MSTLSPGATMAQSFGAPQSPYAVGGPLNYGNAPPNPFSGFGTSGYANSLGNAYQSAYQQSLGLNQQNYGNIIAGYGQLQDAAGYDWASLPANVLAGGASVGNAYYGLGQQVQGQIQGVQQAALQQNTNAFNQQLANINQYAAGHGLQTTGIGSQTLDATQQYSLANAATNSQFAQLEAGYMAQLGSAGIQAYQQANQQAAGYTAQGIQAQTGIGLQQLGFMAGIQIPYPNASAYSQALQASAQYQLQQQALGYQYAQPAYQNLQHSPSSGPVPGEGGTGGSPQPGAGAYLGPSDFYAGGTTGPGVGTAGYDYGTGGAMGGYGGDYGASYGGDFGGPVGDFGAGFGSGYGGYA